MRQRKLLFLIVAFAAGFGGWLVFGRSGNAASNAPPPFQTVEVEIGPVVQRVVTSGRLNAMRHVQVGSQISGIIEELLADFNSPVKKGQVIARIDPGTFEANVRLAEAELARAEAALELARVREESLHPLQERELIPATDMRAAEVARRQAEADVFIRREQLEKAKLELDRCTIMSPTDGIVISRNVDVGQTVAASLSAPVLFEIAEDLSRMEINAFVSEADIGGIREGQRAEFVVDAYRDRRFHGTVRQVRNAPATVDNVVTYDTVIAVDNRELKLKPGMTAEVTIITDERPRALRVRNTALRARLPDEIRPEPPAEPEEESSRDARVVYRLAGGPGDGPGGLKAVRIRTGISDGLYTEILDGLQEGETLVAGLTLRRERREGGGLSLFRGRQAQY